METLNVISKLKEIEQLKGFQFLESSEKEGTSLYGTLKVGAKNFKDSGKNEYHLDCWYSIFIAEMYKGKPKSFFYLTIEREGMRRNFNCKNSHSISWNKLFESGQTIEILIDKLKVKFDEGYEFI